MNAVNVINLATGDEQTYINICPLEALINAAILNYCASQLHNPITRNEYRNKVLFGKRTASIGDFAVCIKI